MNALDELLTKVGITVDELLGLEELTAEPDVAVYVSGSLVDGMGNQTSDVDLYVVGQAEPARGNIQREGDIVLSIHHYGKRRVDFEYWKNESVDALVEKTSRLTSEYGDADRSVIESRMSPAECEFVHRLRIGLPVKGEDYIQRLKGRFDYERIARYMTDVSIGHIDDALEDLYGMMDDLDIDVGLFRARDLLDFTCDAYCHHLGRIDPKRKWRTKVLGRLPVDERSKRLSSEFWRLQFPNVQPLRNDAAAYRSYIEDCIRLANAIVEWIQA